MNTERLDLTTEGLEQRLKVIRRDSDGMTWLQISNSADGGVAACIALDADEAWQLALAMLRLSPTGDDTP